MNIFDDDIYDDHVSEYNLLGDQIVDPYDELLEEYEEPEIIEAEESDLEDVQERAAFDLNNHESNMVYNARIRLEQARLYEMLINHNVFEGVDADPRAVRAVQQELKQYIVRRLELLMGLRRPVQQKVQENQVFNDVEADFLKQLAYKGTLGATSRAPQTSLNTVKQPPKPTQLKSLGHGAQKIAQKVIGQSKTTNSAPSQQQARRTVPQQQIQRPVQQQRVKPAARVTGPTADYPEDEVPELAEHRATYNIIEILLLIWMLLLVFSLLIWHHFI